MSDSSSTIHDYWTEFYAAKKSAVLPSTAASPFAEWVAAHFELNNGPVVEFGCGNGRDSLWFAELGHNVRGFDFAETAVIFGQSQAHSRDLDVRFDQLDLNDEQEVRNVSKQIRDRSESPSIYARFLIHSLQTAGRLNLFDLAAHCLADGGNLYLEFRTAEDRDQKHVFGDDHFRVYHEPEAIVAELNDRGGRVVSQEVGRGFAPYKDEDPVVARLVVTWKKQ